MCCQKYRNSWPHGRRGLGNTPIHEWCCTLHSLAKCTRQGKWRCRMYNARSGYCCRYIRSPSPSRSVALQTCAPEGSLNSLAAAVRSVSLVPVDECTSSGGKGAFVACFERYIELPGFQDGRVLFCSIIIIFQLSTSTATTSIQHFPYRILRYTATVARVQLFHLCSKQLHPHQSATTAATTSSRVRIFSLSPCVRSSRSSAIRFPCSTTSTTQIFSYFSYFVSRIIKLK